jgi:hypothetical protein
MQDLSKRVGLFVTHSWCICYIQMPIATENGVQQQYPSAPAQTWASYDMQRHVSNPHVRR